MDLWMMWPFQKTSEQIAITPNSSYLAFWGTGSVSGVLGHVWPEGKVVLGNLSPLPAVQPFVPTGASKGDTPSSYSSPHIN